MGHMRGRSSIAIAVVSTAVQMLAPWARCARAVRGASSHLAGYFAGRPARATRPCCRRPNGPLTTTAGRYAHTTVTGNGWSWSTYVQGVQSLYGQAGDQRYLNDGLAWGRSNSWGITARSRTPTR